MNHLVINQFGDGGKLTVVEFSKTESKFCVRGESFSHKFLSNEIRCDKQSYRKTYMFSIMTSTDQT